MRAELQRCCINEREEWVVKIGNVLMLMISSLNFYTNFCAEPLKVHELWWTNNVDSQMNIFQNWLGDEEAPSRIHARDYINKKGYKTILDIPCGLCTEYFGYKKDNINIAYCGMDITEKLILRAQSLGVPVLQGTIEKIPFPDSYFDICYARHILEHLSSYEQALSELIRTAQKEVLVIFFIVPHEGDNFINLTLCDGCYVYHNTYNKSQLESFVFTHPKVENICWEKIGSQEEMLHIYLND